jgi:hypothetical protein
MHFTHQMLQIGLSPANERALNSLAVRGVMPYGLLAFAGKYWWRPGARFQARFDQYWRGLDWRKPRALVF